VDMAPEQPADSERGEERMPLPALTLSEPQRRAIGDRLEAAARRQQSRRRWLRTAFMAGAVAAGLLVAVALRATLPRHDDHAEGPRLRTGPAQFQLLSLGERGVAFVSEETELSLHLDRTPALEVHRGSVRLVVRRQQGEPFVVGTPAAQVTVLGTEFDVTVNGEGTEVAVVRGEVEVRNPHGSRRLWPRESARARVGEAPRMVVPMTSVIVDGPAEIIDSPSGPAHQRPRRVP
jgi:ferric-dicitrate binding protein FerR (iron transport regulator)